MYVCMYVCMYVSSPEDMLIDFRERGRDRERERNFNVREEHELVASHRLRQRVEGPTTWPCALTRN